MGNKVKGIAVLKGIVVFIGVYLIKAIPDVVMLAFLGDDRRTVPLGFWQEGILLVLFLATIVGMFRLYQVKFDFTFKPIDVKQLLLLSISVFLLMWLFEFVFLKITGFSDTLNDTMLKEIFKRISPVLIFVTTVIFAPITEELLCREYIMGYALKNYPKIGLVTSILVFTLFHSPTNIESFILYAAPAFALSYVYYRTKRVEYTIGIHLVNNLFYTLVDFLQ
ncbi:CAAX protease self-immunity [Pilibacter termitis]|uniref:CAAX protease self-immunity n=1 Tax=Pilibacter termitis TaxID=263852 RepID=A0A1T4QIR8_9ENTE|nr:type II CAAX endopeptidase family protein [Pilibacter termitis]SKA03537.1 CAAX protease self-immunity [Pilibacter termitis]